MAEPTPTPPALDPRLRGFLERQLPVGASQAERDTLAAQQAEVRRQLGLVEGPSGPTLPVEAPTPTPAATQPVAVETRRRTANDFSLLSQYDQRQVLDALQSSALSEAEKAQVITGFDPATLPPDAFAFGTLHPVTRMDRAARLAGQGAELAATVGLPMLVPTPPGAGPALRFGLASLRAMLAGGGRVGVEALLSKQPLDTQQAVIDAALAGLGQAGSDIFGGMIVHGASQARLLERASEQALRRSARATEEAGLKAAAADVAGRKSAELDVLLQSATTKAERAALEKDIADQAVREGVQAVEQVGAAARPLGDTYGAVGEVVPGVGRATGKLALEAQGAIEQQRQQLYALALVKAQGNKRTLSFDPIREAAANAIEQLETGVEEAQRPGLRRILQGIVDREDDTISVADLDAYRRDLQTHVRAFGDFTSRRSFEKGSIERVYAEVQGSIDDLVRGTPAEGAYREAHRYFAEEVVPGRSTTEAVLRGEQPTQLMRTLVTPANEDRLVRVMRHIPEDGANELRAGLFGDRLEQTRDLHGSLNPQEMLKWWNRLTPRQRKALGGRTPIPEVLERLDRVLKRQESAISGLRTEDAALREAQRSAGMAATQARKAEDAAMRAAMTAADRSETVEMQAAQRRAQAAISGAFIAASAANGLRMIARGDPNGWLWLAFSPVGGRAFGQMMSSPSRIHFLNNALLAAERAKGPYTSALMRTGTQLALQVVSDALKPPPGAPPTRPVGTAPSTTAPPTSAGRASAGPTGPTPTVP